jgi:hypothetical protein
MNSPPFLLGSTILFWGWQSHLFPYAVPMALILELARWIKWRWALSDKDFNRVTDFTSLSFIMATFYLISQQSVHGFMTLLNWLPMVLFLLITAQTYSTHGTINLGSLFFSLRNQVGKSHHRANERINITYPYMMICLLSASVTQNSWFFVGVYLLIGYGLWAVRPSRYSAMVWVLLLGMAGTLAYISQLGIYHLQSQVEEMILSWFQDSLSANRDPYRQHTALGYIGRLKQSDRIVLRVKSPHPLLLREVSYNTYFKTIWRVKKSHFSEVPLNQYEMSWTIAKIPKEGMNKEGMNKEGMNKEGMVKEFDGSTSPLFKREIARKLDNSLLDQGNNFKQSLQVSAYLNNGKGMLALPHGTYKIADLAVPSIQRNEYGAVKVENGPGLIKYTAHFGKNTPLDSVPTEDDLRLPRYEKYLTELSNELNLPHQKPQQVLETLTRFFNHFQYSLNLTAPAQRNITPLEHFLRDSRVGHCEYFATATVLLLRTAGIPSRYASGYAVEEFSHLEGVYLVRKRHAHAWALAYINGRWQIFDTTPAAWFSLEEEMAAWWEPLYDVISWLTYKFSQWRWRDDSDSSTDWLLWLILPLSLLLIWRLYSREKVARSQSAKPLNRAIVVGADSAFYQIVQQLNAAGLIRQQGETLTAWLKRVQAPLLSEASMQTMLTLHQRYRFDPAGISMQEQTILAAEVKAWLRSQNW